MGPDSKPRNVLELFRGQDELVEFKTRWGWRNTYTKGHILVLSVLNKIVKMSVEDYLRSSKTFKHHAKIVQLGRGGLEFDSSFVRTTVIPPYILGLLLGDGWISSKRIELTTADEPIAKEYITFCEALGYKVSKHPKKGNKAFGLYHRTNSNTGKKLVIEKDPDFLRKELRNLGLLDTNSGTKFIPQDYKVRSIRDRLELLAGLIDTDGNCKHASGTLEYCSKSKQLADDVSNLARTLGFVVSVTTRIISGTTYYRLHLAGDLGIIPSRLARKRVSGHITHDANKCNFYVTEKGLGEFFGVRVDGDHMYLNSNCGIVHNCGKSHIAFEIAKSTQRLGGLVVYIDTENATSLDNLKQLGIDVAHRFVFVQTGCTEEVFKVAESTIMKARAMTKDVPVTIIWDSVAASAPQAELTGEYTDNTIGLQARVLGKGLRKIANIIANQKVLFVLLNQQRQKIGVMYGDPCVSPDTKIRVRRHI